MRAIKLKHGVIFAEWEGITLRYTADVGWEISPVMLPSVEWDLRGEGLDAYESVSESDLRALGEGAWEEMLACLDRVRETLGEVEK